VLLTDLLKDRLLLTSKVQKDLFRDAIRTFSTKIDMCYATGLLPDLMHTDLHVIREVRKRFAHRIQPLSFADEGISALCRSLITADPKMKDARERFMYVALGSSSVLMTLRKVELRIADIRSDKAIDNQLEKAHDAVWEAFMRMMDALKEKYRNVARGIPDTE